MVAAGTTPLTQAKAEPAGSLSVALAHANRLLVGKPALAEQQAAEILNAVPEHPDAMLVLGIARRRGGQPEAALSALTRLVELLPFSANAHYELGLTLGAAGRGDAAIQALKRATELGPQMSDAWRALGDQHVLAGNGPAADAAYARQVRASVNNPVLLEAAAALSENRLAVAERMLKDFLRQHPSDVAALRMLAELATRIARYQEAQALLEQCLELAPSFVPARYNYAVVLYRQGDAARAVTEIDRLLAIEPGDPNYRNLKAAALSQTGDYHLAITLYEGVLREYPNQPKGWMSYGHTLKTTGRQEESVAAYRRSIALQPDFGEAYWSLANLKIVRFSQEDVAAMEAQLERLGLGDEDRLHFHFALGKAYEDGGSYDTAFAHYAEGNRIRRAQLDYDAGEMSAQVRRSIGFFTPGLFQQRSGAGFQAPDPIFIVGLPRSGSTLIEQILSSHSKVEGTMELPEISAMARILGGRRKKADASLYPEILETFESHRLREMGEDYIARTRVQRKTNRLFFIDKMPHNFLHVGLIQLILPNAKIIDARRHPMATCLSGFRQHFARGQSFSYDLAELGRYYRDYVGLMAHFDRVLPGKIHRVFYENIVDDTEAEVRRLLDYCGLPFEANCLRFHENDRAVRTASSEQVRRPIFREGLDHWRNYQPWLEPLRAALGDTLTAYPQSPNSPEEAIDFHTA